MLRSKQVVIPSTWASAVVIVSYFQVLAERLQKLVSYQQKDYTMWMGVLLLGRTKSQFLATHMHRSLRRQTI